MEIILSGHMNKLSVFLLVVCISTWYCLFSYRRTLGWARVAPEFAVTWRRRGTRGRSTSTQICPIPVQARISIYTHTCSRTSSRMLLQYTYVCLTHTNTVRQRFRKIFSFVYKAIGLHAHVQQHCERFTTRINKTRRK